MGAYLHLKVGTLRSVALLGGAAFTWALVPLLAAMLLLRRQDA